MSAAVTYTVWIGGESHAHRAPSAAHARYARAARQGVPCSLYVSGECAASANGDGSRVDSDARDRLHAALDYSLDGTP